MNFRDYFRLALLLAMIIAGRLARDAERANPRQILLNAPIVRNASPISTPPAVVPTAAMQLRGVVNYN